MSKDYFKGWYFKCTSEDKTVAFIPAFHRNSNKETASLQIITDDRVFNVPFDSLKFSEKPLNIKIGDCLFSDSGINLNIKTDNLNIRGALKFHQLSPIKYDIMGPFKFIPFMQCRHSVYSMRHRIDGKILLNGEAYNFQNGTGYIEGDCGVSFPKEYVWTQCCFEDGTLMLSVADVPLHGYHLTGIIGVVMLGEKEYRVATYLGAKVKHLGENCVSVSQGNYRLIARLMEKRAHPLNAPDRGKMSRTIHESASCTACYTFSYKGRKLLEFTSNRASFEFEYNK